MKPEIKRYTAEVGGRTVTFETGKLAHQAGGAVTVELDEAMVFAATTMSDKAREGIDFLPMSVNYEERMYAGGRIPGSFFRREGRPHNEAILTSRLIDRPLRPLFPKGMRNDIQVLIYSLSADDNPLDILALNASSAALTISNIPWDGPVGAVRIGRVNEEFVINPTFAEMEVSDLDLRLAGTKEAILMVECGADEVPEDVMVKALELGHASIQPLIEAQSRMAAEVGKPKDEPIVSVTDEALEVKVYDYISGPMTELVAKPLSKDEFYSGMDDLKAQTVEAMLAEDKELAEKDIKNAFGTAEKKIVRERILSAGKRPDGRGPKDIRPIWCELDISPRAHGSAIFTRGETQALTVATLGTLRDAQALDNLTPEKERRYMHHYNFPPFCTGEVRMMRGTSRREVGHGSLAERALLPVIPAKEDFPYSIRLVSEIMDSNGSSSMASVCGSTLSLMATGVPIKAPVSGIAMGLVTDGKRYHILSDILGTEDHLGDMDFKVTGTEKGITALQMDIKVSGLSAELMAEALTQSHEGRMHIMGEMMKTIDAPRPELKRHVPRVTTMTIPVGKIGAIIGPGGKTIRAIQDETGVRLDIEEDGTIFISATDGEAEAMARQRIESLTESAELGRIYTGRVVRVTDFGAFIEILPNMDGLVHISQLDSVRINSVEDVAKVGDEITVMVTNIDAGGKIRLSRKAVLEGWTVEEAIANDQPRGGGGNRGGGNRGGGNRSGGRNSNRR
ncbi:MAG: polyribonucleotide nucleotidyltransferase [Anaerolineales bacterium]|uniref:Polyribonucleotide nucleotidyltransferase n=1 Tax=Candidatus Desulfolinea nitratireducens TaxID=2841698 RepID=A0A8J6TEL5_9CHLR|nr:polyribonucleotide nucleotidyltransferase [Candidatus Desulfolinea nitratireducens]MBL6960185.1 polyribonucleotide nucleotidyltransferase [Anaerolineales bacterium]